MITTFHSGVEGLKTVFEPIWQPTSELENSVQTHLTTNFRAWKQCSNLLTVGGSSKSDLGLTTNKVCPFCPVLPQFITTFITIYPTLYLFHSYFYHCPRTIRTIIEYKSIYLSTSFYTTSSHCLGMSCCPICVPRTLSLPQIPPLDSKQFFYPGWLIGQKMKWWFDKRFWVDRSECSDTTWMSKKNNEVTNGC
mgnify:CR=1 FL=1